MLRWYDLNIPTSNCLTTYVFYKLINPQVVKLELENRLQLMSTCNGRVSR